MPERVNKSPLEIANAAIAFIASRDTPICITCRKSFIIFVNQPFCDLFGYDNFHDLIGCHVTNIIADERPNPHGDDMAVYFLKDRKHYNIEGVVKGRKKDGSVFDVCIHDRDGFYLGDNLFMSCSAHLPDQKGQCIT